MLILLKIRFISDRSGRYAHHEKPEWEVKAIMRESVQ